MNIILGVRNRHVFLLDLLALIFIPALALTLRLDRMDWWAEMGRAIVFYTLVAVVVNLAIFYKLGLYSRYWRYAGVSDLADVLIAISLSTAALAVLFVSAHSVLDQHDLAVYRTSTGTQLQVCGRPVMLYARLNRSSVGELQKDQVIPRST